MATTTMATAGELRLPGFLPQGTETLVFEFPSGELIDGHDYQVTSRATDAVGNVQTEFGQDEFIFDNSEPESSFNLLNLSMDPSCGILKRSYKEHLMMHSQL